VQLANHTFQLLSKHGISPVRPHCANARQNKCQQHLNSSMFILLVQTEQPTVHSA